MASVIVMKQDLKMPLFYNNIGDTIEDQEIPAYSEFIVKILLYWIIEAMTIILKCSAVHYIYNTMQLGLKNM